uniref:Receptor ligand binding region domain-containing protein n=1 Tax=Pseudonaja textilis TaxID=8673 RepID=A0A670ZB06_PSETE
PSFFRVNPSEFPQYMGLVHLLLHFQWNWVGLLAPEDDNGEHFISSLMPLLKEKEICLAFSEKLKSDIFATTESKLLHVFKMWSKAEVIILFGDSSSSANVQVAVYGHEVMRKKPFQKVWILTSHWKLNVVGSKNILQLIKPFHGALHFRHHMGDVSDFNHFLLSLNPWNPQGDLFLSPWWERVFGCIIHKPGLSPKTGKKPCTGKENLENVPTYIFEKRMTSESYNIYNAIYAVAHALHAMYGSVTQSIMKRFGKKIANVQSWQVISMTFYPVYGSLKRKLSIHLFCPTPPPKALNQF